MAEAERAQPNSVGTSPTVHMGKVLTIGDVKSQQTKIER